MGGYYKLFLIRRKMLPTSTKDRPVSCGAQVLAKVGAPFSHALENSLIEGKWVAKPVGLGPVLDVPCWVTFRCGRSAPGSRYAPGPFEWNARWGLAGLALRPSGLMPACVGFSRNWGRLAGLALAGVFSARAARKQSLKPYTWCRRSNSRPARCCSGRARCRVCARRWGSAPSG